jgi:hypothetical protein
MNITPTVRINYLFFPSHYLILEGIFNFIGILFSLFLLFEFFFEFK